MLSENGVVVGWSWTPGGASVACEHSEPWRELDRQLKAIAKRRAALDADELALIREAVRIQLWRPLGMTSIREYLERRMGYGPQVAAERLRVAEALDALPATEAALERGELSYSAVRELTRITRRITAASSRSEGAHPRSKCAGLQRSPAWGTQRLPSKRGVSCATSGSRAPRRPVRSNALLPPSETRRSSR